jgi:hypothetical protein
MTQYIKKHIWILVIGIGFMMFAFKQSTPPVLNDPYFFPGEKYVYNAHYGPVSAGKAEVYLKKEIEQRQGKPVYEVKVVGKTTGIFSYTMEVLDTWVSYVDTSTLTPVEFSRDLLEGPTYRLKETTIFNPDSNKATVTWNKPHRPENGTKTKVYDVVNQTQDMVSGYYFLRRIDYDKLEAGQIISMPAFLEDSLYNFQVKYNGIKEVYTNYGKLKAYEMSPILPPNDIFTNENAIRFYVSTDKYRVPLKIEADLYYMGAIELELESYSGVDLNLGKNKSSSWF